MLDRLTVGGFRGLSSEKSIHFAKPNGESGSGLTVLVGTNNAGKSTFVEALRLMGTYEAPHFGTGARNLAYGDRVQVRAEQTDGKIRSFESARPGTSTTTFTHGDQLDVLVVPSRRSFEARFGNTRGGRGDYGRIASIQQLRQSALANFAMRLFELDRDEDQRKAFGNLLERVLGYEPQWALDSDDSGNFFLRFMWEGDNGVQSHTSEGLGDGLISLFVILDALRDAAPGSTTVIDEPELSLHPQFQRRLQRLMSEMSGDRQIVYSTHSPYFVDWADIANGASVTRIFKTSSGTTTATPTPATFAAVHGMADSNQFNPHVLGLDANEVFFLEGGVLLTEGQEDVVVLPKVLEQVGVRLNASYFGWGAGGATNMRKLCQLLMELGYAKVVGILDNDMQSVRAELEEAFPAYMFVCIATDDIRDKKERGPVNAKVGLVDSRLALRAEYAKPTKELFETVSSYLAQGSIPEIL
jgi:predicted ATPase